MKKIIKQSASLLLPAVLLLSGCEALKEQSIPSSESHSESQAEASDIPFIVQVKPETFELSLQVGDDTLQVSNPMETSVVADYKVDGNIISWSYPDQQISISLNSEIDYLGVQITSEKQGDNRFTWPKVLADHYYFPFGEGKRVPSNDSAWQAYLDGKEFSVLERLSMPFWIASAGQHSLLFILEDPYRTQLNFLAEPDIGVSVSHDYPEIDQNHTKSFRIYIADNDPVNAAKLYRNYVIEKGNFTTLEQKALENPNIRKLYGAPFIYLWGDFVIESENINWQAFRKSISSPIMNYIWSFSDRIENGTEAVSLAEEIKSQDYISENQKNELCNYISQVLLQDDFYNTSMFSESSVEMKQLLEKKYENLSRAERIQVNKYALAANLPAVFESAGQWMNSSTEDLFYDLKNKGIDQAWIGLNSWEQAYAKPELVSAAVESGYLIASYDSYHSIHEPGKEEWITAQFPDPSLYEDATITTKNGEKAPGFQKVGRKLNPALSLPFVKERMDSIMANKLLFNSWFIDCDATGEIYDDYTQSHITTQREDLAARLERMAYIRDQYHLVVGSEGGNDFSASTISFAHGIELQSFSWMDEDMKANKESAFYVGKYYNPNGGVAEKFAKRVPIKDEYYTLFLDPKYDIPLFKLVYNDSVITSYHWDWSTFKIQGATQDRMLREVLYNVPPLYHLDAENWNRYQDDIVNHHNAWSKFSQQAITQEMTDFSYLLDNGSVQQTKYGQDLMVIANFNDFSHRYQDAEIPPHSVLIQTGEKQKIYTPSIGEDNQ